MTKHPEDVLYKLKMYVEREFFKANPPKEFPEDFLSGRMKKELKKRISYPAMFKSNVRISGPDHRIRYKKKISIKEAMAGTAQVRAMEGKSKAKYVEILLPAGRLKLKMERKVQICFESGAVLMEFGSLERAKYVLYSRKVGKYVYKVPKSEIAVKRAVAKYEKYRGEIREKLVKAFMARKVSRKAADGFAGIVFEERLMWMNPPRLHVF